MRAIRPVHTTADGDSIYAVSLGDVALIRCCGALGACDGQRPFCGPCGCGACLWFPGGQQPVRQHCTIPALRGGRQQSSTDVK